MRGLFSVKDDAAFQPLKPRFFSVFSFGKPPPGSIQGDHIYAHGVVTAVRSQTFHPLDGCYRVPRYGAKTQGSPGTERFLTMQTNAEKKNLRNLFYWYTNFSNDRKLN